MTIPLSLLAILGGGAIAFLAYLLWCVARTWFSSPDSDVCEWSE